MRFAELVEVSRAVASTRARSTKVETLAGLLARLAPDEIPIGVAYLSGHVRQGRIGLGPAALRAGRAAAAAEASLTLAEVDAAFERIAGLRGPGSTGERGHTVAALFGRATSEEQDFLARLIHGELRQGALEGVMEDAVARASRVPIAALRRAAMLAGALEPAAVAALERGSAGLAAFQLRVFQPLRPMLAQPAEDLESALERAGEAALEYKLDGARIQVHKDGDVVRLYSRGLNDVTAAAPEIVTVVRALPAERLILDGEAVALRADGAPQPFQVTMRRFGRRLDVETLRETLPLTPFLFDVLHRDGDDLLDRPARQRLAALRDVAPALAVPQTLAPDATHAAAFLDEALARGHEGIMVKSLAASYEAGRRGDTWLKVKREHTLDLVVLAVERGSGRRTGTLSNLHLGARDPATHSFVMLGKTFKGMTDAMLAWQTEALRALAVTDDGWVVHVRPELVVEIAFNDVQESPHYPAGMALRFARVRGYRPEKRADEADTVDTVRQLLRQSQG